MAILFLYIIHKRKANFKPNFPEKRKNIDIDIITINHNITTSRQGGEQTKEKILTKINQSLQDHKDIIAVIVSAIFAKDMLDYLKRHNDPEAPINVIIIDEPKKSENVSQKNVYILDQSPYQISQSAALQLYNQLANNEEREEIILPYEIKPSL